MEIAATERLRLRPLQAGDLRAFVVYRSHPDVARYQSWDPTYAMSDAEALLAAQADVAFGTPGAWVQVAALDRASGELVGDCAVRVLAGSAGERRGGGHARARPPGLGVGDRGPRRDRLDPLRGSSHAPRVRRGR